MSVPSITFERDVRESSSCAIDIKERVRSVQVCAVPIEQAMPHPLNTAPHGIGFAKRAKESASGHRGEASGHCF